MRVDALRFEERGHGRLPFVWMWRIWLQCQRSVSNIAFRCRGFLSDITCWKPSTSVRGGCPNKGFGWGGNGNPRIELPLEGNGINEEQERFGELEVWRRRRGGRKQARKMAGEECKGNSRWVAIEEPTICLWSDGSKIVDSLKVESTITVKQGLSL